MINVYDGDEIIGRVNSNQNLDFWDGNNWTCGSTGRHLGITKLKKTGQFVLIHTTQWEKEERNHAEIVTEDQALQEILRSGDDKILKKYFPDHKELEEE